MSWSIPSNNTGVLTRPNAETTFGITGAGSHDIITAESVQGGPVEVVRLRNYGGGNYEITILVVGSAAVRFHGESVN